MVVDDDPDIRESMADVLIDEGCTVALAADGQDALRQLEDDPLPCLLLVDLKMPGMGGDAFCQAWKASPRLHALPLIIVSGDALTPQQRKALGATSVLRKPMDIQDLKDVVSRHVARRAR